MTAAFLTVREASRILSVSKSGVYRMVKDRVLPSLRLTRRRIRIPVAAIQRLMDSEIDFSARDDQRFEMANKRVKVGEGTGGM
jgi:excisionase family DNA binding protein